MSFAQGCSCISELMSEWFSNLPTWFFILLAVGIMDALIQLSDYLHWRKERIESEDASE